MFEGDCLSNDSAARRQLIEQIDVASSRKIEKGCFHSVPSVKSSSSRYRFLLSRVFARFLTASRWAGILLYPLVASQDASLLEERRL